MNELIKIYQPAFADKRGFFSSLAEMTRDLIKARELIWRLFLRDFKARYKQSLLGWGWILLLPLIAVGTFYLLNRSGIIRAENLSVPYVIYGLLSISLWQVFASGLSSTTGSIVSAGSFVVKINFSKEALVIASIGQAIVEFIIRIILLILLYLIMGLTPSIWIIILPLLITPLVLLTLGLGFITSLLNTLVRDVQNFINMSLGFLLFFMPIMYTTSETGLIYQINEYNPLYFLISVPRDIVLSGRLSHIGEFLISSLISIIIFIFGWFVFDKAQSKIAEAM